jgi:hypothetical protein
MMDIYILFLSVLSWLIILFCLSFPTLRDGSMVLTGWGRKRKHTSQELSVLHLGCFKCLQDGPFAPGALLVIYMKLGGWLQASSSSNVGWWRCFTVDRVETKWTT